MLSLHCWYSDASISVIPKELVGEKNFFGDRMKVKGYDGKESVRELARVKMNIIVVQNVALRSKKELGQRGLLAVEHCVLNT